MSHSYQRSRLSRSQAMTKVRGQRGSALVIGIFIITVMFLMSATLINVVRDADEQVNLEVWGTRALAAANSGADFALSQLLPIDGSTGACALNQTWTPPNEVGFANCSVTYSCVVQNFDSQTQYRITSRASCESSGCASGAEDCLRVSREVEVQARD
ncbi:MSHA biogenesis protein MshP [Shewanella sp. Scap07]|uniref:MSHA biogenesis protein MshP n=1 Tax=Shewanella sp. Scap07 TaxID=2589987 RepID=UPI0015B8A2B4|nr:MSHA biogenesis protein MshP [Shewanella sp. Scap07]